MMEKYEIQAVYGEKQHWDATDRLVSNVDNIGGMKH